MIDRDTAAALNASLAELDSRLVTVIDDAICELWGGVRGPKGDYSIVSQHIARAVWAWLAEGDE